MKKSIFRETSQWSEDYLVLAKFYFSLMQNIKCYPKIHWIN